MYSDLRGSSERQVAGGGGGRDNGEAGRWRRLYATGPGWAAGGGEGARADLVKKMIRRRGSWKGISVGPWWRAADPVGERR